MKILLDTNMCIYVMNKRPRHVVEKFNDYSPGDIGVSAITVAELEFGVAKSEQVSRNGAALIRFLASLEIVPFGASAGTHYGRVKADLRASGRMIGELDCLIAAQALALDIPIVTNHVSEFERVEGLALENWA